MPELRVVVVDDEPLVRQGIRGLLASERDVQLAGEARDGAEAVAVIRAERPDAVFLDVRMPELDGFGVIDALAGDTPPAVVFVTAFDQYAIRAFDAHAVDYLLKPFDEDRFRVALDRVRTRLGERTGTGTDGAAFAARIRAVLRELGGPEAYTERLLVKRNGTVRVVQVADIDWLEAAGNYVRIHANRSQDLVRETIGALEQRLDPRRFARVHRSAIVNLSRVRELQPLFNGEASIMLSTGARVTLSRSYRDAFRARLGAADSP